MKKEEFIEKYKEDLFFLHEIDNFQISFLANIGKYNTREKILIKICGKPEYMADLAFNAKYGYYLKELPHLFFYQKFRGKQVVESELWISDF